MRLLLLCNRDFASYYALQQLLPLIPRQTVLVLQTAQVGAPRAVPIALAALARHEQGLLQDQLSLLQGADFAGAAAPCGPRCLGRTMPSFAG